MSSRISSKISIRTKKSIKFQILQIDWKYDEWNIGNLTEKMLLFDFSGYVLIEMVFKRSF